LPPGRYTVSFNLEIKTPDAHSQLKLEVADTPASVREKVLLSYGGFTYRGIVISSTNPKAGSQSLANLTIQQSTKSTNAFTDEVEDMSFTWASLGYLSFAGFELSTKMSVYLISISLTQTSATV
jgi:hypothetical protein